MLHGKPKKIRLQSSTGLGDDRRCGHCQKLAPVWDELATYYKSDDTVHIGKV